MRIFDGKIYGSFTNACVAKDLLGWDEEWQDTMKKYHLGYAVSIGNLSIILLVHCKISLFKKTVKNLITKSWYIFKIALK